MSYALNSEAESATAGGSDAPVYKKLTINLTPQFHEELQEAARERGITVSELVRRAIALDRFLWSHRDDELLLKSGDEIRQLVLM